MAILCIVKLQIRKPPRPAMRDDKQINHSSAQGVKAAGGPTEKFLGHMTKALLGRYP
jgi:hypothetical protein